MAAVDQLPVTLSDLLANTIILRQIAPDIPIRGLLALSATCSDIRNIILSQSEAWRYLNLTSITSAMIDSSPIDVGGVSWRAERMDESLTEDDFYSGPLRGIFGRLHQKRLLRNVHTLVLDGLTVPADLVREIVSEDRYNVRILSLRESKHLNQTKLQQVLRYIVRPTRSEGTPKLKALYFFKPKDPVRSYALLNENLTLRTRLSIMEREGAQIGAQLNRRSYSALSRFMSEDESRWYGSSGRVLKRPNFDWPETLQACKGAIAFDAVLCRGIRHDITKVDSSSFLQPAIATVALGRGCEICGTSPEGRAAFGTTPSHTLPLLCPVPSHSTTMRALQAPTSTTSSFYARCEDCLRNRWCEGCNRWWCEACYNAPGKAVDLRTDMQQLELREDLRRDPGEQAAIVGSAVKLGVNRDCWDCGPRCEGCRVAVIKICKNTKCSSTYCSEHDLDSSPDYCSWCSLGGGLRTREPY